MNEKRKQELTQLLNEAIENLEILPRFTNPPLTPVSMDRYKGYLEKSWTSYSPDTERLVRQFKLKFNGNTKSKLLDLISLELDPFIHEGRILTGYFYLQCARTNREIVELNDLLEKLLNIAIFGGIEAAVSAFGKSISKDASVSFESITLLKGITLEAEIQVFDGIRLVPIPASSDLPRCLGSFSQTDVSHFYWETMLVIDYSISPIFQKPSLAATAEDKNYTIVTEIPPMEIEGFQIKAKGGKSPECTSTASTVFHQKFCQALSLACNSGVEPSRSWKFVAKDELLNINPTNLFWSSRSPGPFGDRSKVSEDQINKAKCLYEILVNSTSNTPTNIAEKLKIPIDRWIKSKINKDPVDKMIDLGTAFEPLFLPSDSVDQLAFQFRLRASWHLGKDKADREKLMDEFKAIYTLRSRAVHNGELPANVKIRKGVSAPTSEFIPKAQDLCRRSIMKILGDREFPDWKSLVLGGKENE